MSYPIAQRIHRFEQIALPTRIGPIEHCRPQYPCPLQSLARLECVVILKRGVFAGDQTKRLLSGKGTEVGNAELDEHDDLKTNVLPLFLQIFCKKTSEICFIECFYPLIRYKNPKRHPPQKST
jgi:hypothetical protein